MKINKDTEYTLGGFVVFKSSSTEAIGIIFDKEEVSDSRDKDRWGKYWYGVKWLEHTDQYPPSEGPWSLPDFEEGYIQYIGTNHKSLEVLYGFKV